MTATHAQMERAQLRVAALAFYRALPPAHRTLVAEMAEHEGCTVAQLVGKVWADRIDAYIREESP